MQDKIFNSKIETLNQAIANFEKFLEKREEHVDVALYGGEFTSQMMARGFGFMSTEDCNRNISKLKEIECQKAEKSAAIDKELDILEENTRTLHPGAESALLYLSAWCVQNRSDEKNTAVKKLISKYQELRLECFGSEADKNFNHDGTLSASLGSHHP